MSNYDHIDTTHIPTNHPERKFLINWKAHIDYELNTERDLKRDSPEYINAAKYLASLPVFNNVVKIYKKWETIKAGFNPIVTFEKRQISTAKRNELKEIDKFIENLLSLNTIIPEPIPESEIISNSKSEIEFEKTKPLPPIQIMESTPNNVDDDIWIKHYSNTPQPSPDPIPSSIWPDLPIEESAPYEPLNPQPIPMPGVDHIQAVAVPEYHKSMRLLGLPLTIKAVDPAHLENLSMWLLDNHEVVPAKGNYIPRIDYKGCICKEFMQVYFSLCTKNWSITFYQFCSEIDCEHSVLQVKNKYWGQNTKQVEDVAKRPAGRPKVEKIKVVKESNNSDSYLEYLISNVEFAKQTFMDAQNALMIAKQELKNYKELK